jgi:hypothetical protein
LNQNIISGDEITNSWGTLASKVMQNITVLPFGFGITHNGTLAISNTETGRSLLAYLGIAKLRNIGRSVSSFGSL